MSSRKIVSIEAGVWWTKVALVDYRRKQPNVYQTFMFETPEHAVEDGYVRDKETYAECLKEQLRKHGIREKEVVFTLSSSKVITREVTIPYVKENKIMGIIDAQVRDYFPMDVSNYTISYSKMDEVKEDNKRQLKLLLVAIPDNLMANYLAVAQAAGLKVETFDYIGNGTVQFMRNILSQKSVIVQLEEQATVISIFDESRLVFQRITPYGFSAALASVVEHSAFGIESESRAFEFLQSHDVIYEEPPADAPNAALLLEAYEDLREVMNYHIRVVNTAIEFYQNQIHDTFQGSLYLVGDGSRLAGMSRMFEEQVQLYMRKIDYALLFRMKAADTADVAQIGFISLIGAAVKPMDAKPRELVEAQAKKVDLRSAYTILAGAALISVVLVLTSTIRQIAATNEQNDLAQQIESLSYIQAVYDENEQARVNLQAVEKIDAQTETLNEQFYDLVEELEDALPGSVQVESLSVTGDTVTLNMKADEKITVAQMLLCFADVDLLTDISIPSIAENVDDESGTSEWSYTVTAYYNEVTEESEAAD